MVAISEASKRSMLDEIRDSHKHAEACAQQAAAQTDPKLRQDFFALEAAWLNRIRERAYEITKYGSQVDVAAKQQSSIG